MFRINQKIKTSAFLPVIALIGLSACATIVSKSDYPVSFTSNAEGTNIKIKDSKGMEVANLKTPATQVLKASDGFFTSAKYKIEASKPGYTSSISELNAKIDPWYFGNIVFGGLIGLFIVDPATGAMWKLEDNHQINMSPISGK